MEVHPGDLAAIAGALATAIAALPIALKYWKHYVSTADERVAHAEAAAVAAIDRNDVLQGRLDKLRAEMDDNRIHLANCREESVHLKAELTRLREHITALQEGTPPPSSDT